MDGADFLFGCYYILTMSSASESKMDPTKTLLGRMLLEEVTPLVMVLSTSSVEESCQKNGLTFLQMLLPFCFFNKIDGENFRPMFDCLC